MPRRDIALRWLLVSVVAFIVSLVLVISYFTTQPDGTLQRADSLASISSLLTALATFAFSVVTGWLALRPNRPSDLDAAAEHLARKVQQTWFAEIGIRKLRQPQPLRLRWEMVVPPTVAGGEASVESGALIDQQGEQMAADPLVRAFRALPTRQLVIRGAAGSGKSTLAMLFTAALLGPPRPGTKARMPATEPVPVLLPLAGWRPDEEPLRSWAARSIAEHYAELTNTQLYGPDAPRALLDQGDILLVLDGLDEMPPSLMDEAVRQLGDVAGVGGIDMVITCRAEEYDRLAVPNRLPLATVLTLRPVTVADSVEFLTGPEPAGSRRWEAVIAEMVARPSGAVAAALSTPLMIALARGVYQAPGSDPTELTRLPSAEAIEHHLLDRFLPTVYRREDGFRAEDVSRAARWLATLARHLRHRLLHPDLAWWELGRAVPSPVVPAVIAALIALVGAVACALVQPFPESVATNIRLGAALGLGAGVVAGLNAARGAAPGPLRRRRSLLLRVLGTALRDGFAAAVVLIAAMFVVDQGDLTAPWDRVVLLRVALFAAVVGTALSLITSGLRAWRGALPHRPSLRLRPLLPRLAGGIGTGLLLGVPIGTALGLVAGTAEWDMRVGVRTGVWTAVAVAAAIGVPVGIGRWVSTPLDDRTPVSPRSVLVGDFTTSLAVAASAGISAGLGIGGLVSLTGTLLQFGVYYPESPLEGGGWGALAVFGAVLLGSGSPWVSYTVARCWLAVWGRLPWRLIRFLEDAHGRGILRQIGPVYRFRHDHVERHLARDRGGVGRRLLARLVEARTHDTLARARRVDRWVRRRRVAVTSVAAVALPALVVTLAVPGIREQVEGHVKRQRIAAAGRLVRHADAIAKSAPDDALRLRIAAAEIDPEDTSRDELSVFLRLRATADTPVVWGRMTEVRVLQRWVLTVGVDGAAQAWDRAAAAPRAIPLGRQVASAAVSPGDRLLLTTNRDGDLVGWDLADGQPAPVALGTGELLELGDRWIVLSARSAVTAWDLTTEPARPVTLPSSITGASLHDDERWLLARHDDETLSVWDLTTVPPREFRLGDRAANRLDSWIQGETAVVEYDDGTVQLWNLAAEPPRSVTVAASDADDDVLISPDGRWALICPPDQPAKLFALAAGGAGSTGDAGGHPGAAGESADISPVPIPLPVADASRSFLGNDAMVLTSRDGEVQWQRLPGAPQTRAPDAPAALGSADQVEFSTDGRWALLYRSGGHGVLWDLGAVPARATNLAAEINYLGSWIDDEVALVEHTDGRVTAWHLTVDPPRPVDLGVGVAVERGPEIAGHRWLLVTAEERSAWLWDVSRPGARPVTLVERERFDGAWMRHGWAFVRHADGSGTGWDLADGRPHRVGLGPNVDYAAPSHNRRWAVLRHHSGSVYAADNLSSGVFPPDSHGQLVTVWDLAQAAAHRTLADPIGQACRLVGRGLDRQRWEAYAPDVEYHEICRPRR